MKAGDRINTDYERFLTSGQERIRLDMAIRVFCHGTEEDLGHRQRCGEYLRLRHRALAQKLLDESANKTQAFQDIMVKYQIKRERRREIVTPSQEEKRKRKEQEQKWHLLKNR